MAGTAERAVATTEELQTSSFLAGSTGRVGVLDRRTRHSGPRTDRPVRRSTPPEAGRPRGDRADAGRSAPLRPVQRTRLGDHPAVDSGTDGEHEHDPVQRYDDQAAGRQALRCLARRGDRDSHPEADGRAGAGEPEDRDSGHGLVPVAAILGDADRADAAVVGTGITDPVLGGADPVDAALDRCRPARRRRPHRPSPVRPRRVRRPVRRRPSPVRRQPAPSATPVPSAEHTHLPGAVPRSAPPARRPCTAAIRATRRRWTTTATVSPANAAAPDPRTGLPVRSGVSNGLDRPLVTAADVGGHCRG